jgi:hypothetical protein
MASEEQRFKLVDAVQAALDRILGAQLGKEGRKSKQVKCF